MIEYNKSNEADADRLLEYVSDVQVVFDVNEVVLIGFCREVCKHLRTVVTVTVII